MDRSTFDALTRRVARQTTRRAALATLLGGALLLHNTAVSEATKEGERRKDRRRKERRSKRFLNTLKPISVRVFNPGTSPVSLKHGWWYVAPPKHFRCVDINSISIPPGENRLLRSPENFEYLWINNTYWIDFRNGALTRPTVSAALNGTPHSRTRWGPSCPPLGTTVLDLRSMSEGNTVPITINGRVFTVTRNRDTKFKEFTLTLPANL